MLRRYFINFVLQETGCNVSIIFLNWIFYYFYNVSLLLSAFNLFTCLFFSWFGRRIAKLNQNTTLGYCILQKLTLSFFLHFIPGIMQVWNTVFKIQDTVSYNKYVFRSFLKSPKWTILFFLKMIAWPVSMIVAGLYASPGPGISILSFTFHLYTPCLKSP